MPPKKKSAAVLNDTHLIEKEIKSGKASSSERLNKISKKEEKSEILENNKNSDKPDKKPRVKQETKETEKKQIIEPKVKPVKTGKTTKTTKNKNDEPQEIPVKKGGIARKVKHDSKDDDDEVLPKRSKTTKKTPVSKSKEDTKVVKNQTITSYDDIDFKSFQKNKYGKEWNFKISSWNVDGIRAWFKKGGLEYIHYEKPDIFCLQETKCSEDKLPSEVKQIDGYQAYWQCSKKEGYAGVGLYTKKEPLSVTYGMDIAAHDEEGRMVTAEYDKFYVISVYVPNAGRGLVTLTKRLQWNKDFRKYIAFLNKNKPVIICGDMNVAHTEIDLANPKTNTKNAGFSKEEREDMTEFLNDGYVDTFRELYPDKTQVYTFWSYMNNARAKNIGWRLDYFIVPKIFMKSVCDNMIRNKVFGSDHCPLTLFLYV